MSDRWGKLQDRYKAKGMDLDAEFEKFMNESMSDESSMGSPRMKTSDLKSKPAQGHMPWWAEEDGEEDRKREAARQSWMKPKIRKQEVKQQEPDAVDNATTPNVPIPHPRSAKGSATALSVDSAALSISKDSLEEGLAKSMEKTKPPPEEILKRLGSEDFEDTFTYSDESKTGASANPSPPVPQLFTTKPGSLGLDTLNEQADKEQFFNDIEGGTSAVDYNKKLHEISTTESVSPDRRDDERLQATGAELGDSIFNTTGATNQMNRAAVAEDMENEEEDEEYSDNFEDVRSHEETEDPARPSAPEPPEATKPSLLSKVSLMESLDSTLETKRPAAALSLLSQQKKPQAVASSEVSDEHLSPESNERVPSMLRTGPDYDASGSTRDIHELQAALQAAQLTATGTGTKYSGNFELPPASKVIQGVDESKEGQIIIEKNHQGETRARGFDLQPVVVTDDWRDTNETMATRQENNTSSFVSVDDERGFGLKPVRDEKAVIESLRNNGQALPSSVESSVDGNNLRLVSEELEPRGLDLTPAVPWGAEGRGFDLQPVSEAPGFSLQPVTEARGIDLKPAVNTAAFQSVTGGRGFDLQPAQDGHGFSLQRVANLLQSEGEGEEDEDEDTPPPESLQSIKSIARARKSAGKDGIKKSTDTNATAKKASKVGKEKSSKKSTIGERPQQKKEKGKVARSSVDKSNLFKPSPSSAPSWSPTPTLRSSKTKVR